MGRLFCYNAIEVKKYLEKTKVFYSLNVVGSRLSTFLAGGIVDIVAYPTCKDEVAMTLDYLTQKKVPYYVLGNGSNTLIRDGGFRGVILSFKKFKTFSFNGTTLLASAGALLPVLAVKSNALSLSGLEELSGIPCSVGGAVYKNAGCYGKDICSLLRQALCYDTVAQRLVTLTQKDISYSYRSSHDSFKDKIVLEATLELKEKVGNEKSVEYYRAKRTGSQPLLPSLGSVFLKSETNLPAGLLIDEAGLKGTRIGGAVVSEKHANFIVNVGGATAKDYLDLVELIKSVVRKRYDVTLKEEIDIIGED